MFSQHLGLRKTGTWGEMLLFTLFTLHESNSSNSHVKDKLSPGTQSVSLKEEETRLVSSQARGLPCCHRHNTELPSHVLLKPHYFGHYCLNYSVCSASQLKIYIYIKRGWHQSGRKDASQVAAMKQKTEEQTHKRNRVQGSSNPNTHRAAHRAPPGQRAPRARGHWAFLLRYHVQTHFGRSVSSGPES